MLGHWSETLLVLLELISVSGGTSIATFNPSSRAEFDEYCNLLAKKISTFETNPSYAYFVENLVRELIVPLSLDDTRKVSSTLTAMINEKQKAQKSGNKKKKGKVSLQANPRGELDISNYDTGKVKVNQLTMNLTISCNLSSNKINCFFMQIFLLFYE
jgi:translation initiation factor 3 subunit J